MLLLKHSHEDFLTNAMHQHREIIESNKYTMLKERKSHNLQKVKAKDNITLSYDGPSQNHQASTNGLKLYIRAIIESKA